MADSDLETGLEDAKKKPRYFALIMKGQTIVKMIVQKKRIKDGDIMFARREYKGNESVVGVCSRKGMEMALQVVGEEEPTLKPMKIKEFIGVETGIPVKPHWELVTELAELDDEDEIKAERSARAKSVPLEKKPPSAGYVEVVEERDEARPEERSPPPIAPSGASYVEVKAEPEPQKSPGATYAVTKEEDSKHEPAKKETREESRNESSQTTDTSKSDKIKAALKKTKGDIQKAILARPQYKDEILGLVARIKELLKDKEDKSDLAMSSFRELVALLATVLKDRGAVAADQKTDRLVTLRKSRVDWDSARKRLHAQLQSVTAAILKECANPEEYDQNEVKDKLKALDRILERLDTRLIAVLDQALNAKDAAVRGGLEKQAAGIVEEYLDVVTTDALVAAVDESGLVSVPIQESMSKLLADLAGRLAM